MTANNGFLPLLKTVAPADQAAVAEAVRAAYRDGTPVYPIGGGTGLDYGVRPDRPGIGLSLGGLNRVIDHAADDLTITVEAGVTVAGLARQLAARRQRLPVDIPQAERATIGGVVATDPSGPRRYAHGTMRDYVIGLSAVDGLGQPFSGGGRVVKNAAGYNLCRLMVGSLGTLGVITQVTLMVRPMVEASALVAGDVADFAMAERLLARLVKTKTLPVAVDLLAGAIQSDDALPPLQAGTAARLMVGFEGSQVEVDWMVAQLYGEWQGAGIASPAAIPADQTEQVWDWLRELPADLQISALPSTTVDIVQRLLSLDPECAIQAHAGNGVHRVRLSPREPRRIGELLRDQIRPAVAAAGGRVVLLSCPDGVPWTVGDVWGPPGDGAAVMRAIKDRFDPKGLLNPGRFIFE